MKTQSISTIPTVSSAGLSDRALAAARLSFSAAAFFVLLLALLHVLRPDLDPSWRFISEYELGDYGWLMRAAFFCLAVSCLALCFTLWSSVRGIAAYIGLALLVVTAVGMILAALFAPGAPGHLHDLGAMLDQIPFVALLINWKLLRSELWAPVKSRLLWSAPLPLLGMILFVAAMIVLLPKNGGKPGPDVLLGWPNRIMILTHCAWLMLIAWTALKLPSSLPAHRTLPASPAPTQPAPQRSHA